MDHEREFCFIHFGWKQGPFSNSSAGCTIGLSRRFSEKCITRVEAPPEALLIHGRGGSVQIEQGLVGVRLLVGYFPPPQKNHSRNQRGAKPAPDCSPGLKRKPSVRPSESRRSGLSTATLPLEIVTARTRLIPAISVQATAPRLGAQLETPFRGSRYLRPIASPRLAPLSLEIKAPEANLTTC